MSDQDQDSLIQNFCAVTGSDPQQARHFLEASNWNIESATEQFFEADEPLADAGASHHHLDSDSDGSEALYDPPRQAPGGAAASSSKSKFATLGDLKGKDGEEDGDSEDEKQDLFAGGEKSGLAVQNPGDPRSKGHLIQDILKRAAEGGPQRPQEEEAGPSRPRFSGTGRTLGSDDTESIEIPDPDAERRRTQIPTVTRSLTFWRDGFSVEDGPLMRYDDPANQDVLRAIQRGRAPLSLMNVEPGQPADVNVFRRTDEDYVPTKKKLAPFSGAGQRLGSPTPGTLSSPTAPPPVTPPAAPPTSASAPAPTVNVDDSAPHTTLQVRLGDGTRLRSRFNHSHTVGDVYGFVNSASPESRTRSYLLQTTFPTKELKDMEQTIKDAGLINAVVVQKWA